MIESAFQAKSGNYRLEKLLGKGKSGYSYLALNNSKQYVLKKMHNEPCPYYTFGDKTKAEIRAYQTLRDLNIPIPELIEYDFEKQYLIKIYIDGKTGAQAIAEDSLPEDAIRQLFIMSEKLAAQNLNIDYFPTNFIINRQQLCYIDYEINNYDSQWSLENWGLFYWANKTGMKEYLEVGNSLAINQSLESGIPIKMPFKERVSEWIRKYSLNNS